MARKKAVVEIAWLRGLSLALLAPPLLFTLLFAFGVLVVMSGQQGGMWELIVATVLMLSAWITCGTMAVTVRCLAIMLEATLEIRDKMQEPIEVLPVKR